MAYFPLHWPRRKICNQVSAESRRKRRHYCTIVRPSQSTTWGSKSNDIPRGSNIWEKAALNWGPEDALPCSVGLFIPFALAALGDLVCDKDTSSNHCHQHKESGEPEAGARRFTRSAVVGRGCDQQADGRRQGKPGNLPRPRLKRVLARLAWPGRLFRALREVVGVRFFWSIWGVIQNKQRTNENDTAALFDGRGNRVRRGKPCPLTVRAL